MKAASAFLVFCFFALTAFTYIQTDKKSIYKSLASGRESSINEALKSLESAKATAQNNAYKGALTMKKAGFEKGVNSKVKTFKKGAHLLEDEIKSDSDNVEFRFLRLTIQEHAPSILKYNKQIDEDKQAVIGGFDKLGPEMQEIVKDYTKDSKVLKLADLK